MEKYLTRQRKRLLEYLSNHTDEQMTARQIADALTADNISISAVYRNLSALEEEGLLKRSIRENTREVYYQYIAAEKCKGTLHLSCCVCGKIIHLGDMVAEQLLHSTMESTGFRIDKSETILYGVCADCRK
ncbi:MAG: transcriptional repressor [Clostridiales bacterium]|nr:transcriptional repressor [Clostridiales bacterium]